MEEVAKDAHKKNKDLFRSLNKLEKILLITYLVVSISIYLVIIVLDVLEIYSISFNFKFSAVVINAAYALFILLYSFKLGNSLVSFTFLGLLLTIFSDYFLGYRQNEETSLVIGVLIFILVQIAYFLRTFIYLNKKEKKIYIIFTIFLRLLLIFIGSIAIRYFQDGFYNTPLNVLALIYFLLIVMNFVDNIYISIKFDKRYFFLALGFLLFIFCDISVGLNFMFNHRLIYFLIYLFYIPSQILITISSYLEKEDK